MAIVDWDVHHGNGTQDSFWTDPAVLTISLHQEDLFPPAAGCSSRSARATEPARNINLPLPAGSGRAAYLAALDRVVIPALEQFAPSFVIVGCGFDASMNDPLGGSNLTSECFALMTDRLMSAAESLCAGRLVLCHEGGYSSAYLPYCGLAVVERLAGTRTEVIDPWLTDARQVRELPLRAHEAEAVEAAVALHGLG